MCWVWSHRVAGDGSFSSCCGPTAAFSIVAEFERDERAYRSPPLILSEMKIEEAARAAASSICNDCCSLYADRFGDLHIDWGEPVVAVGAGAVDDAEELVMQCLGDGAHRAVPDEDAIDRAEMGDLGGGAGEEGLVADVDHLAEQCLLDDFDAELLGQCEDRVAGDAVEYGVRQWRSVEDAAADEEKVL